MLQLLILTHQATMDRALEFGVFPFEYQTSIIIIPIIMSQKEECSQMEIYIP